MFKKILIANRGEIACRIIRTAHRLGICCVAIYSEADATALHVKLSDEAFCIGPAPSRESYLQSDAIIELALKTNVEAIHPGYGFLSENADFAESCVKANICFIGPPPNAIRAMGSKSTAKCLMAKANVPLVPGYHGTAQNLDTLQSVAEEIGYPVLLKAAAGGGGKGMRTVWQAHGFEAALISAKREALASFGDDQVLIEKYLTKPRHVEIQIFADTQDNIIHLFERDCSIQRRHQKIIEEAPAPHMTSKLREQMGEAAIAATRTIGYVGAGTVEFLLDEDGSFYFMEMNTRLQVEHPVTEMITRLDLVEWQFRVALGESLPLTQDKLKIHGHAFETRIYAEDPNNDFLPSVGTIKYLSSPTENQHVRIDTGVTEGDPVSHYYDPMIAKLIVWDKDRATALQRLKQALAEYQIVGVTTNLDLLTAVCNHSAFTSAKFDTGFIQNYHTELFVKPQLSEQTLALACLYILLSQKNHALEARKQNYDFTSPWHTNDSWRLNLVHTQTLCFQVDGEEKKVLVQHQTKGYLLTYQEHNFFITGDLENSELRATIDIQKYKAKIFNDNNQLSILSDGIRYQLRFINHDAIDHRTVGGADTKARLTSPMPGKVVALLAATGIKVEAGANLAVVEAMKMEHTIQAPTAGIIKEWYFQVGDIVDEGVELLAFEAIEREQL